MTYFIPHLKKKMLWFLVLADFKLFLDKRLYVSFLYQYPILSSLIYSYQIFNKSGLLPQDCLSSDYLLFDNCKSGLTRCHLPRSRVAPKLMDWGPEPRLYLRRMQPDTWWRKWWWYRLLQSGQNKSVLFLDVDQDTVIWSFIHQRWLWNQICTRSFQPVKIQS